MAASSCQDEPVLQLVQGRTPKDEQNLGYLGWIMMDPNISKPIGPLDHWLYHILGDDGDEYPLISYWGGDQGTRVLTLQLKDTQRK